MRGCRSGPPFPRGCIHNSSSSSSSSSSSGGMTVAVPEAQCQGAATAPTTAVSLKAYNQTPSAGFQAQRLGPRCVLQQPPFTKCMLAHSTTTGTLTSPALQHACSISVLDLGRAIAID